VVGGAGGKSTSSSGAAGKANVRPPNTAPWPRIEHGTITWVSRFSWPTCTSDGIMLPTVEQCAAVGRGKQEVAQKEVAIDHELVGRNISGTVDRWRARSHLWLATVTQAKQWHTISARNCTRLEVR
jgi:hypothetical protein